MLPHRANGEKGAEEVGRQRLAVESSGPSASLQAARLGRAGDVCFLPSQPVVDEPRAEVVVGRKGDGEVTVGAGRAAETATAGAGLLLLVNISSRPKTSDDAGRVKSVGSRSRSPVLPTLMMSTRSSSTSSWPSSARDGRDRHGAGEGVRAEGGEEEGEEEEGEEEEGAKEAEGLSVAVVVAAVVVVAVVVADMVAEEGEGDGKTEACVADRGS